MRLLNNNNDNKMIPIEQLNRDGKGLDIIKISDNKEKVFFRTSTILDLIKCPYKAKFLIDVNQEYFEPFENAKYAVIGALIHELVEYLLINDRFNLFAVGLQYINHVYNNIVGELSKKYVINLFEILERDKIINAAITAASFISKNFKVTDTEKVFVFEDEHFILKITPDIITDNSIVDLKTKYKSLPSSVPYEHAFQMNIYSHYLNLDTVLFYIHIDTANFKALKPGKFENIRQRINDLAKLILNQDYEKIDSIKSTSNCYFCKYKTKCKLYTDYVQQKNEKKLMDKLEDLEYC